MPKHGPKGDPHMMKKMPKDMPMKKMPPGKMPPKKK